MRIAYLVLAHNAPAQLARLVAAIKFPAADLFIHIDGKSDINPFMHMRDEGVHFLGERHRVFWGDFSQVEAILALMRCALAAGSTYTRFILLSGVCYPIRSTGYIENFLRESSSEELSRPLNTLGCVGRTGMTEVSFNALWHGAEALHEGGGFGQEFACIAADRAASQGGLEVAVEVFVGVRFGRVRWQKQQFDALGLVGPATRSPASRDARAGCRPRGRFCASPPRSAPPGTR